MKDFERGFEGVIIAHFLLEGLQAILDRVELGGINSEKLSLRVFIFYQPEPSNLFSSVAQNYRRFAFHTSANLFSEV